MGTDEAGDHFKRIGRYVLFREIAAGGMATAYLARLAGPAGRSSVVAVKRLHPQVVGDDDFTPIFIDEAKRVVRLRHPNLLPTLDVVGAGRDIYLVMEYVDGELLGSLQRAGQQQRRPIPLPVSLAAMVDALQGLHALHEARDSAGEPLGILHGDISPASILVGLDGITRLLDRRVTRALGAGRGALPGTVEGEPGLVPGEPATRQTDVLAACMVLRDLIATAPIVPRALAQVLARGLASDPRRRHATAGELAEAIARLTLCASQRAVGDWVADTVAESLRRQAGQQRETDQAREADQARETDQAREADQLREADATIVDVPPTWSLPPARPPWSPSPRSSLGVSGGWPPLAGRRALRAAGRSPNQAEWRRMVMLVPLAAAAVVIAALALTSPSGGRNAAAPAASTMRSELPDTAATPPALTPPPPAPEPERPLAGMGEGPQAAPPGGEGPQAAPPGGEGPQAAPPDEGRTIQPAPARNPVPGLLSRRRRRLWRTGGRAGAWPGIPEPAPVTPAPPAAARSERRRVPLVDDNPRPRILE
jgi:serine/threonine-protein kinase